MKLFDDFDRVDRDPSGYGEPIHHYVDRTARRGYAEIRELHNAWYERLPDGDDKLDLGGRFRKRDGRQHMGAWWELYLHEAFRRIGFAITSHLSHTGQGARPDFWMERDGGGFWLEATTSMSGIVPECGRDFAQEGLFTDAVNKGLRHRNFMVSLEFHASGQGQPSRKDLAPIGRWLDCLPPGDHEHRYRYVDDRGWNVTFWAHRLNGPPAGEFDRIVGSSGVMGGSVDDGERLRLALLEKRSKYELDGQPYVIAVLADAFSLDDTDLRHALWGTMRNQLQMDPKTGGIKKDPKTGELKYGPQEGLWFRDPEPRGDHVSAVLVASGLGLTAVDGPLPTLLVNPRAIAPLSVDLPFRTRGPGLDRPARETAASLFQLPEAVIKKRG